MVVFNKRYLLDLWEIFEIYPCADRQFNQKMLKLASKMTLDKEWKLMISLTSCCQTVFIFIQLQLSEELIFVLCLIYSPRYGEINNLTNSNWSLK